MYRSYWLICMFFIIVSLHQWVICFHSMHFTSRSLNSKAWTHLRPPPIHNPMKIPRTRKTLSLKLVRITIIITYPNFHNRHKHYFHFSFATPVTISGYDLPSWNFCINNEDIHATVRRSLPESRTPRTNAFFATARGSERDFDRRAANRFNKRHFVGKECYFIRSYSCSVSMNEIERDV